MSIRKEDKELPEREGRGERDSSFSFVQPQQHTQKEEDQKKRQGNYVWCGYVRPLLFPPIKD